jgi:hypothetical protein
MLAEKTMWMLFFGMGNCESCLDLLELKFLQSSYTRIPEGELSTHSPLPSHRPHRVTEKLNGYLDDEMLNDPTFELIRTKCNSTSSNKLSRLQISTQHFSS